jgi:hypothetical protein
MRTAARSLIPWLTIAASIACGDRPATTAPEIARSEIAKPEIAMVREIARGIALAMASADVRIAVRDAMRASPWDGHSLVLQEFAETPAGEKLVGGVAAARGLTVAAVKAELAALPLTDFNVPVRAHRRTWTGDANLVVVSGYETDAPVVGYMPSSRTISVSRRTVAGLPTAFMLEPAEYRGRRVGPQPSTPGLVIEEKGDGRGSEIYTWRRADGNVIVIDMAAPDAAKQLARLRATLAALGAQTQSVASNSTASSECDPRIQVCDCSTNPEMPECSGGGSNATATLIGEFIDFMCDNDFCWTEGEFRFEASYYSASGAFLAQGTYYRGGVPPNEYQTWDAVLINERILQGSQEYMDIKIVEEDRNDPFGGNLDDDCGTKRIFSGSNDAWTNYPNTWHCVGEFQPNAVEVKYRWSPRLQ